MDQTLAETDFGETDEYGIWNPKEYTGTYYTTTSTATGALPIHTTTDIYGETKGSGNRTDANAANLVLVLVVMEVIKILVLTLKVLVQIKQSL